MYKKSLFKLIINLIAILSINNVFGETKIPNKHLEDVISALSPKIASTNIMDFRHFDNAVEISYYMRHGKENNFKYTPVGGYINGSVLFSNHVFLGMGAGIAYIQYGGAHVINGDIGYAFYPVDSRVQLMPLIDIRNDNMGYVGPLGDTFFSITTETANLRTEVILIKNILDTYIQGGFGPAEFNGGDSKNASISSNRIGTLGIAVLASAGLMLKPIKDSSWIVTANYEFGYYPDHGNNGNFNFGNTHTFTIGTGLSF